MKYLVFIFCVFGVFGSADLRAKDSPIEIDHIDTYYNPALYTEYLHDPNSELRIQDVLHPEANIKFIPSNEDHINFGYEDASYWLKFEVQNKTNASLYLEINNPLLDTIEYYLVNNSSEIVHHETTGASIKVQDRKFKTTRFLLDMNLNDSSTYTCYVMVKEASTKVLVPMRIGSLEKFFQGLQTENIWHGIYLGLILFLFIYNIFLFSSIRDTSYLYFSLFIGFTGLLFSLYSGIGRDLLWDSLPINIRWLPIIGASSGTFMILFSSRFLNSRRRTPRLHYWLMALVILNLPMIALDMIGFHSLAEKLIIYNALTGLFLLMVLAVKSWRGGYQPAKFYLLSWSFYVIGIIFCLLINSMVIKLPVGFNLILQVSSSISIFLMSFALSKKINIYIKKRNEAQQLVLMTAMENEQLISDQNQLLEAKVNQRTIDLEQTISTLSKQRKDLHEANSFKDKVFSIISHDLKSPISSLAGLLQVMKMKTLNEEERSKAINSLEIALKGTKNLLDNILAWANKNRSNVAEEIEEIELNTLVDEIFQIFQFQASNKGIILKNLIEYDFHIVSNKDMLQLVIRNLVSNALKFTKKEGFIEVGMRQDFLNIEIFVKDSGIGMSEKVVSNLFRTNQHNSTRGTENEKGTGLGLILCKEFIEKYNGSIHVKSQLKKGSTFTLKLNNAVPILETVMN